MEQQESKEDPRTSHGEETNASQTQSDSNAGDAAQHATNGDQKQQHEEEEAKQPETENDGGQSTLDKLNQVNVDAALDFLDQQVEAGYLTSSQAEDYRNRFKDLLHVAAQTAEQERSDADEVQRVKRVINEERKTLDQTVKSKERLTEAVEELAQEKDKATKDLEEAENIDSQLHYECSDLKRTNEELQGQLEAVRQANKDLVEPELEGLMNEIREGKEEQSKIKSWKENAEKEEHDKRAKVEQLIVAKEEAAENVNLMRQEWNRVRMEPERIEKQSQSVHNAVKEVSAEVQKLNDKIAEADKELKRQIDKRTEASKLQQQLQTSVDKHRAEVEEYRANVAELEKSITVEEKEYKELNERKLALQAEFKNATQGLRDTQSSLASLETSYERSKKELKRRMNFADAEKAKIPEVENDVIDATHGLRTLQREYEHIQSHRTKLRKDVDILVHKVLVQESGETKLAKKLQDTLDVEASLEQEKTNWNKEEQLAQKQISALKAQRDLRNRELSRTQQRIKSTDEELLVKKLQLTDLTKQANETIAKLQNYSKLYESVKNERNSYVNAIQASSQALAEMKERVKILQNEVEILQNESIAKDKALSKERLAHADASVQRDALRFETNKAHATYKDKQRDVEQQIVRIDRLNSVISNLEKAMLQLKKQYEKAVEDRNHTGIQLIDRNDELCILYEKSNVHEDTMRKGNESLAALDVKIRELQVRERDLERELDVVREKFPKMPQVAEKVLRLQKQLASERKFTEKLSVELENPSHHKNWQPLEGYDADSDRLSEQVTALEERLNEKREKLLERELVLEELNSLSENLNEKAMEGKQTTNERVDQVHSLQSRLQNVTKKMMSLVSELSMYQATSMKLEEQKAERQKEVEEAENRLQRGEVPSEETVYALRRKERYQQIQRERKEKLKEEERQKQMPVQVTRTTAEQRPNAYVPEGEAIAVPKPYGANAPFKPQKTGSTMRNIRKPKPKEIEL